MRKNTKKRRNGKPSKPYPDFPLGIHPNGQFIKRIRGKLHYFGADPDQALDKWLREKDYLLAGKTPPVVATTEEYTLRHLVNSYLNHKRRLTEGGELSPRTLGDAIKAAGRLIECFDPLHPTSDIKPDDFRRLRERMAKSLGALALGIEIQRIKAVFRFGFEEGLLDEEMRYGRGFDKPAAKVLAKEKSQRAERILTTGEIHIILDAASVPMRAMILLGLNCALGNNDLALLPLSAVDLGAGWLDYPRPKTGVARRCPLWPETVAAIREYQKQPRATPKNPDDAELLFLTRFGVPWVRMREGFAQGSEADETTGQTDGTKREKKTTWIDSVGLEFGKLLRSVSLKRPGVNFYTLRHVHRTLSDGAMDQAASDAIMGHKPSTNDMAARYRHGISDERLKTVSDHVRKAFFPRPKVKRKAK